jgi:hypothetical protein
VNKVAKTMLKQQLATTVEIALLCYDNFRMNTGYGRYGAAYNMVGFSEELLCV